MKIDERRDGESTRTKKKVNSAFPPFFLLFSNLVVWFWIHNSFIIVIVIAIAIFRLGLFPPRGVLDSLVVVVFIAHVERQSPLICATATRAHKDKDGVCIVVKARRITSLATAPEMDPFVTHITLKPRFVGKTFRSANRTQRLRGSGSRLRCTLALVCFE
jgi:hypothetical protein